MTFADMMYAWLGLAALLAAVLPRAVAGRPVSMPLLFTVGGFLLYKLPLPLPPIDPVGDRVWAEHATEACVLISLMGAGLAIDRPVGRRAWSSTWRLLGITMPLTIAAMTAAAWALLDWPLAAALLLAAALAPTDPVLAAEVRVGEPTDTRYDEDEVRFALTSEAGLNDGLALPAVLAAIALAASAGTGWSTQWIGSWALVDALLRCSIGVLSGLAVGRLLGWLFFRTGSSVLRLSQRGEGFVALGATFLTYGVTEMMQSYGFIAVFTAACAIRATERAHGYQKTLHRFVEQVERLLTVFLLFLLGGYVALGGLNSLTWQGAAVGLLLLAVIRPATAWLALLRSGLGPRERAVSAVFGVRGIGSLFYIAFALGRQDFFTQERAVWAVVTFTVLASVVCHGMATTPVIGGLDRQRRRRAQHSDTGHGDTTAT